MPAPYRYTGQVLCKLITIHRSGTLTGNRLRHGQAGHGVSIGMNQIDIQGLL